MVLGVRLHRGVQIDLHQGVLATFVSDTWAIPVSSHLLNDLLIKRVRLQGASGEVAHAGMSTSAQSSQPSHLSHGIFLKSLGIQASEVTSAIQEAGAYQAFPPGSKSFGHVEILDGSPLPISKLLCVVTDSLEVSSGNHTALVTDAYKKCFSTVEGLGLRHLSLARLLPHSLILDGESSLAAFRAVREWLDEGQPKSLRRITFVLDGPDAYELYRRAMFAVFPEVDQE